MTCGRFSIGRIRRKGSGDRRDGNTRSGVGEHVAEYGAQEGGGSADQKDRTHRQRIVERTADGTGENVSKRHHAEGEGLSLGGILGVDV